MNEKDFKELEQKAIGGDPKAQYYMGLYYENQLNDNQKAFLWFSKSFKNKYPDAYLALSGAYIRGDVVEEDKAKAFELVRYAAEELCHNAAYYFLGLNYVGGIGCKHDFEKGVQCMKKSAELGFCDAAEEVACVYLLGYYGVEKDCNEAAKWFERAYGLGKKRSAAFLCHIYKGDYCHSMKNKKNFERWSKICHRLNIDWRNPHLMEDIK